VCIFRVGSFFIALLLPTVKGCVTYVAVPYSSVPQMKSTF
jgi:hypothetical protein